MAKNLGKVIGQLFLQSPSLIMVSAEHHTLADLLRSRYLMKMDNLFVDFCARHDLVIGGRIFPHKDCHKVTWVSPDHETESQINHVAVGREWRRSLLDVRNKGGADIGSDHHLVVANFKLKIQTHKQRTKQLRIKYGISRLKNDKKIQELLKLELTNRFQILTDMERVGHETIEGKCRKIRTTFTESSQKVLGFKEKKQRLNDSTDLVKDQKRKRFKDEMNVCKIQAKKIELQKKYTEQERTEGPKKLYRQLGLSS